MSRLMETSRLFCVALILLLASQAGCRPIRVPAIDPTGNRIFLPCKSSTTLLTPNASRQAANPNPYGPSNSAFPTNQGLALQPLVKTDPAAPAFKNPAKPASCISNHKCGLKCNLCGFLKKATKHVIPKACGPKWASTRGQLIMTPHRIIAPVGSEVVVLSGICGDKGYYLLNQPLEWMMSNDSVGQFIEVGKGSSNSDTFNRWIGPTAEKIDGTYARGRTGLHKAELSRGTPTPLDDIQMVKGQTFISVSSESSGTSYITGVARKAKAWDKRKASTIIHWVDGVWAIPVPTGATAGTVHPLTTVVSKSTTGGGVAGWKVRYTIVGGAPAEFAPTGAKTAEATTDTEGKATVQLRQVAGQFDPGTTQIRVDVIRPAIYGEAELQVESGITSVAWSAPALTIRASGPKSAGVNEAYNYRLEITNPGDQVARGVRIRTKNFDNNLEFISSTPKPTQYGREFEWLLGDIAPSKIPKVINIQVKSAAKGNVSVCFDVASQVDGLQTEACAQTEITVPCLGLKVEGPETARVGDKVKFSIVIANQCEETLKNVRMQLQYDTGISIPGLGNPIAMPIGELAFGDRREVPIEMIINQPGTRCFDISITADGGHTAIARECLVATQAVPAAVVMTVDGNRVTEVGRRASVRATIRNTGSQVLNDLTLTNRYSKSLRAMFITPEYKDRLKQLADDELAISVGSLAPGQQIEIQVDFQGLQVDGNASSEFTLTNLVGTVSQSKGIGIRIEPAGSGAIPPAQPAENSGPPGVPSGVPNGAAGANAPGDLHIDLRAVTPNVALNQTVRFEFIVSNQRAAADQNIEIALLVPATLQLVDLKGVDNNLKLNPSSTGQQYFIEPRREMIPGEKLTFIAACKAVQAGQATFEVQARSALVPRAVSNRAMVTVQ